MSYEVARETSQGLEEFSFSCEHKKNQFLKNFNLTMITFSSCNSFSWFRYAGLRTDDF